jgi:hypothetical protein
MFRTLTLILPLVVVADMSVYSRQSSCINTIAGGLEASAQPVGNPSFPILDSYGSVVVTTANALFRLEDDGTTLTALAGDGFVEGYADGIGGRFNGLHGIVQSSGYGIVVGEWRWQGDPAQRVPVGTNTVIQSNRERNAIKCSR